MIKNKILPIVFSIMILFTPCFVGAVEGEEEEPTPTYSITLNKTELNLTSGETETLVATVSPDGSEVEWSSNNEEVATVNNNGKVTAGTKEGQATITAMIKDTNEKATCTVNVTAGNTKGTDATLKSLNIKNGKLNKNFNPNVFEYTVTVDSNVTVLEFDYELSDDNAHDFGPNNNKNLKNGDQLKIKVVAEDEKTNHTYILTISKPTTNTNETSLNLKSLKINGYALNETFKASTLKYTANIPYEIDTITVEANPEDSNANVTVSGTKNLKVGENTVTITVKDNSGKSKVYQIVVTREKEASVEEKPTSIITSSSNTSSNIAGTINYPNTNNPDSFLKYAIVSLACLILFAIGGIGIYFYMKTSPKRLRKELSNRSLEMENVEVESPIVEASPFPEIVPKETHYEELTETKELKKEDLLKDLFNDRKDV